MHRTWAAACLSVHGERGTGSSAAMGRDLVRSYNGQPPSDLSEWQTCGGAALLEFTMQAD